MKQQSRTTPPITQTELSLGLQLASDRDRTAHTLCPVPTLPESGPREETVTSAAARKSQPPIVKEQSGNTLPTTQTELSLGLQLASDRDRITHTLGPLPTLPESGPRDETVTSAAARKAQLPS